MAIAGYYSAEAAERAGAPATAIFAVTLANSALPNGVCRALVCGTSGTLNGIDASGNTVTGFPLQQGYNPISMAQCSTGGTASNIWAVY
jgi:hypothetical protein